MTSHLSLAAFKILFLSLSFKSLIIMCLGVVSLGSSWGSINFLDIYIHVFHQISDIVYSNIPSAPFSSSSGTPTRHLLAYLMVSHWSLRLCSLFLNCEFVDSFFCLFKSTFESLLHSSFQLLYFLPPEFLFWVSF